MPSRIESSETGASVQAPTVISLQAPSVEGFNQTMKEAGWDLEFLQINHGARPVEAIACATSAVALLQVEFDNHIHQRGSPPLGFVTFGMPSVPQRGLRFGTRDVDSESIMALSGPSGFDAVTDSGYSAYTVSISTERLAEVAAILEQPGLEDGKVTSGAVYTPDSVKLAGLRTGLNELFRVLAEQRDWRVIPTATSFIKKELPIALLQTLSQPSIQSRISASQRIHALKRARDFIAAHGKEPITVLDLCKTASCSLRTLNRAFHEQFGVSPKRYLTAFRLAGVRRSLLLGTVSNIGDAAAEWGFWHASKFTQDYKRMYSELPSATLHRATFPDRPVSP